MEASKHTYKAYGPLYSSNSNTVLVTASYTNTPLRYEVLSGGDAKKALEILNKAPFKDVPILEITDTKVAEAGAMASAPAGATQIISSTHAILRHLARDSKLYKKDRAEFEVAEIDQWLGFSLETIEPSLKKLLNRVYGWEHADPKPVIKRSEDNLHHALNLLNTHLGNTKKFLVGNSISIADIAIVCQLVEGYRVVVDKKDQTKYANVTKWIEDLLKDSHISAHVGSPRFCTEAFEPGHHAQHGGKGHK